MTARAKADQSSRGLERRKSVRVRMRPNLLYITQEYEGRPAFVVKDPVSLTYFRLDEGQHFVVGLMDGSHTLEEIRTVYEQRFRPERLPLEELEAFASQLLDGGLAQNESPAAGRLLAERAHKHRRQAFRAALLNFLAIRVPLFDPDRLLGWLAPRARLFFSVPGVLLGLGLVLIALGLIVTRWDIFLTRMPSPREFFTSRTLLLLWLALGLAKVLHELGHGLSCKLQGCEVREAGVLFLVFFPTLYCNVSDSWTLRSKWRRMAISAEGVYIDLLLAALAIFAWWGSPPGTVVHDLSFALALACGVGTLVWNANPLMRYDGYYVLADWLEVPNLAERSTRLMRSTCLRWLGFAVLVEPVSERRRPALFVVYAIASYLYRIVILIVVLSYLFTFLRPHKLGSIGYVLGAATLLVLVVHPVWSLLRDIHAQRRWSNMNPARGWLAVGVLLFVGVLVFTFPYPRNVTGQALLEVDPDRVHRIVIPELGGFVETVLVRDGQEVRAGDVLAVLSNPKLEARLRVNEVDQALRTQQRGEFLNQLTDPDVPEESATGGLQQTEFELTALGREHSALRHQRDRLTLRAPADGVILGLLSTEARGKWLERGTELCRVGAPKALRAVLLLHPSDHQFVRIGGRAQARVHGLGASVWEGVVADVAQVDVKRVPPQLSSRAGGEVATQPDGSGAEKPREQHYLAWVTLSQPSDELHPGLLGRVKIQVAPQTGWWRLRRFLAKTFDWGL